MRKSLRPAAIFVGTALLASPGQAGDLSQFLNAIPASTNAITVIRMNSIMQSPLAAREGWAQEREAKYQEGETLLPHTSEVVLVATKLTPGDLADSPTIGFLPLNRPVTNRELTERERGEIQPIGGEFVVLSSRNAYFLARRNYLAVVSPANRQEMAEWVRFARKNSEPAFSPYLQEILKEQGEAQLLVAIDPQDILDPRLLKSAISESKVLSRANKADAAGLQNLLLKLKGCVWTVKFAEEISGTLRLDFDVEAGQEARLLKPFLAELLGDLGAEVDDFSEGRIDLVGKAALIHAKVTREGLRHVLSLVLPPIPRVDTSRPIPERPQPRPRPVKTQEEREALAALEYFRNVNRLLDELQRRSKNVADYEHTAVWHETYARRISQMSAENVDPELIAYGARVANELRALADSLRGVAVEVASLEQGISWTHVPSPGWSWWWPYGRNFQFDTNLHEIRMLQAQKVAKGAGDRLRIWNLLRDDRQAVARKMTERHKLDFTSRARW
jgi:hypothetical protein